MPTIASTVLSACFVAASVIAQDPSLPASRPPSVDPRGVPSLSAAFRLPAGQDRVLYDAHVDGVWALGATWKARFGADAVEYIPCFGSRAPRNFPIRMSLRSARVGDDVLATAAVDAIRDGDSVRFDRGALVERYELSLDEVEQSFTFATLPSRGAVEVALAVGTELVASPIADGLRFANEHGHVDYVKAVAIDAAGRRLELPIGWRDGAISLTIPADFVAAAQLPLVLDPVLTTVSAFGSLANQSYADVATLQNPDRLLVTWLRTYSAGDEDCYACVYDNAGAPVGGIATIDFTSANWYLPRAASNQSARNFLIVGQIAAGGNVWVGGRTVTDAGATAAYFDIERSGVVGMAGATSTPTVGGDPSSAAGSNYCVAFTKSVSAGNADIYLKLVRPNSTLVSAMPTLVANDVANETWPALSESNGGNAWMLVWNYRWLSSPFDTDVRSALVTTAGAVTNYLTVAGSFDMEDLPSVSSVADIGAAQPRYMVVWTGRPDIASQADIYCRLRTAAGTADPIFNVSAASAGGNPTFSVRDQSVPRVDTDGSRFVVAYEEFETFAAQWTGIVETIAVPSPGGVPGTPRFEETRVVMPGRTPNVAAFRSGSQQPNPRYVLAGWNPLTTQPFALIYGGYTAGAQFSTYPSQCGSLPITATGDSVVGGTVTISVPNTGLSGTIFGYPGYIPLAGLLPNCNCVLGVNSGILSPNPLVWTVPSNAAFVGTVLSVQGYSAGGTSCMTILDLSNTVDFTIR